MQSVFYTPALTTSIVDPKLSEVSGVWFESEKDNTPKPFVGPLPQLLGLTHQVRETKSGTRCFSLVTYASGAPRGTAGVQDIQEIVIDYDHLSRVNAELLFKNLTGYCYVAYTSYSHGANGSEDNCYRVILLLDRPVTPAEFELIRYGMVREFQVLADDHARDAARIWYVPSCPSSRLALSRILYSNGRVLQADDMLELGHQYLIHDQANRPGGTTVAPVSTANSLGSFRERLGRAMKDEHRPLLQPVLDGQPFAAAGNRNQAAWNAVGLAVFLVPGSKAEEVVDLFLPSVKAMAALDSKGALTKAQVEDMVRRAMAAATARGAQGLQRGDEVELGTILLAQLSAEGAVISDRDQLFTCGPTGLWTPKEPRQLSALLQQFAGARVGEGKQSRLLKVSSRMVTGAIELAKAQVSKPGFFADGPHGIAFTNCFAFAGPDNVYSELLRPDHRAISQLPFPLDWNAGRPLFEQFLDQVFGEDSDANEKEMLLQEFTGACLLGIPVRYAKALVLLGRGRNGKGTFLSIIEKLFPANLRQSIPPHQFEEDYHRIELEGVRINLVNELPRADILRGEAFKSIIAGDPIAGRRVREAVRTFKPIAGHVFAANALPSVDDMSRGFWERLVVVPFNRVFEGHQRDKTLANRIVEQELPGIAAWALEGAARLLQRGQFGTYTEPASNAEALATWRKNSDQVALFVEDATRPSTDIHFRTSGAELYAAYRDWAVNNGHRTMRNNMFAERLEALGFPGVKPKNRNYYPLVVLRPS